MSLPTLAPRCIAASIASWIVVLATILFTPSVHAGALPVLPALAQGAPALEVSLDPMRTNAVALGGEVLAGDVYIFVTSTPQISDIFFYLDEPPSSGNVFQHEGHAPYDFAGTASGGVGRAFDTTTLVDGTHEIYAVVAFSDNTRSTLHASFLIQIRELGSCASSLGTSHSRSRRVKAAFALRRSRQRLAWRFPTHSKRLRAGSNSPRPKGRHRVRSSRSSIALASRSECTRRRSQDRRRGVPLSNSM